MDTRDRSTALIIAFAAGTVLMVGCDQRGPANSTASKTERAADRTTAAVGNAADKTVAVGDDAAITAKVKAAILAEPGLKSLQITVDTSGATVTLTGTVDNPELRVRVKQIASNTSGVKGVVDQLTVKSS